MISLGLDDPTFRHQRFDRLGQLLAGDPNAVFLGLPALHGPDAPGGQRRGQLALALPVADQDPPLLLVDDPPRGLLGRDRLAVVEEIDAAGQAIGIVAFRLVDHQASLRRHCDFLGAEIVRHVHFRSVGQLPEPPQQFPAVAVRHLHLGRLPQGLDHPCRSARLQRRNAIVQEHQALLEDRPRRLHGHGFVAALAIQLAAQDPALPRVVGLDVQAEPPRRPVVPGQRPQVIELRLMDSIFSARASRCVAASLGRRNCCMLLGNSACETRDDE